LQVLEKALRTKGLALHDQFCIVAEIGNTAGIIGGIKSGLGVSILSTRAIEDDLWDGRLKALDIQGLDLERHIYLIVDQRRSLSPLARAFRDYVMENVEK
jgi:DNA-binding transcriptional LysR family regulator